MINKAILVGRLGKDPEVKQVSNGTMVKFSVATSKKIDGKPKSTWHNIVAFGKVAEIAQAYIKKGSQVYLEGEIANNTWETKEGEKRTSTNVVAQTIRILSAKNENAQQVVQAPAGQVAAHQDFANEEIPF